MKIVIADSQPLFIESLSVLIGKRVPNVTIVEVNTFDCLVNELSENGEPDLLLFDLQIKGNTGLSGVSTLHKDYPELRIVALSIVLSPMIVYRSIKLGACGFISKLSNRTIFSDALSQIIAGEIWIPEDLKNRLQDFTSLTNFPRKNFPKTDCLAEKIASLSPRQFKVLSMISDGQLNKQIAYELNLQEGTIKHHVSLIFKKLNVINRTGASNLFNRLKVEERLPSSSSDITKH